MVTDRLLSTAGGNAGRTLALNWQETRVPPPSPCLRLPASVCSLPVYPPSCSMAGEQASEYATAFSLGYSRRNLQSNGFKQQPDRTLALRAQQVDAGITALTAKLKRGLTTLKKLLQLGKMPYRLPGDCRRKGWPRLRRWPSPRSPLRPLPHIHRHAAREDARRRGCPVR